MKKLFNLEFKRLLKSKQMIYLVAILLGMIIVNLGMYIADPVFKELSDKMKANLIIPGTFSMFTQFSFFLFAPAIGMSISGDFDKGIYPFYRQYDISYFKYYLVKLIINIISILLPVVLVFVGISVFYQKGITSEIVKTALILALNMLALCSIGTFISSKVRKPLLAILAIMGVFIVLQLVGIGIYLFTQNYMALFVDSFGPNSYSSYYISSVLFGQSAVAMNLEHLRVLEGIKNGLMVSLIPQIIYILITLGLGLLWKNKKLINI